MSVETLTIVISAIGIVLTLGASLFGGLVWIVRRIDAVDTKLSTRIDGLAGDVTDLKISMAGLNASVAEVKGSVEELKISDAELKDSVGELRISVARLEGPPRHLISASR